MKQPPLIKGLPFLGSLIPIRRSPLMFLLEAYHNYGSIFRLRVLGRELVVLAGIEANRLLMQSGSEFAKGGIYGGFNREFGKDAHFSTVDGAAHSYLRHTAKAGYSRGRLAYYRTEIIKLIRAHVQQWARMPSIELIPAIERLAFDIVGTAITHYDASAFSSDIQTFVKWLHWVYPMRAVPQIALKLPFFQEAKRRTFEMAELILSLHPSEEQGRDLIDDLQESSLERHQVIGQTISPYFVGIDTIASASAFMMYLLLKHSQILEAAQPEAQDYLAGKGANLKPSTLLKGVIQETIRLYPIAPLLIRRAEQDFEFANYAIEKGKEVIFATAVCHYLPEFFPEPYAFRPERPPANAGAFSGWGLGVHTCLGTGMAESLLALIASVLISETEIALVPPHYQLRQKLAPIPSPVNLRIAIRSRSL